MKIRFTPAAVALGLAAGMLMSTGALAADTIKIAIAGPFTGPVTQYGAMVKEGVDTAIEQINASDGVLGKQLEAVTIDDACEPKQGPVVAKIGRASCRERVCQHEEFEVVAGHLK